MYGPPQSPGSWGPPPPPPPQWSAPPPSPPQGAWGPYPFQPPPPPDPAASKGNWAMGLSIAGFVLCCAPLGIVGAIFGIQSLRMSKARGTPTSVGAVLGLVLGSLSIFTFIAGGLSAWKEEHARNKRITETTTTLEGKLDQPRLDEKTACALIEKELLKGLYDDKTTVKNVKCDTAVFSGDEKRASLRGVVAEVSSEHKMFTACFARSTRWLALSVTEGGEACPTTLLPGIVKKATTEAELETEESLVRRQVAEREYTIRVDNFALMLSRVQDSINDHSELPTTCPTIDLSKIASEANPRLLPSTVDFDYLAAPADTRDVQEDWSFMTSDRIKTALDKKKTMRERSDAVREATSKGGHYLVVFVTGERDWPVVQKSVGVFRKKGFAGGTYEGSLIIVDTNTSQPICGSELAFETSQSVRTSKEPSDEELLRKVKANLKQNFESNAGKQTREMTDGKLRLGYSLLD